MSTDNPQTNSPFNFWWIVSGIVVVLAVVALVLVLVFGPGNTQNDDAGQSDGGSSAEPTPSADTGDETGSDAAECDVDSSNQDIPVEGPTAEWVADDYLLVPSSTEFGPAPVEGSSWGCFAHSPTGALFAAANAFAEAASSDYAEFMEDGSIDNAARQQWIDEQDPSTHIQEPGRVAQLGGFQMRSVDDDAVTVDLAFTANEVVGSMRLSMVWDTAASTWKIDMATSTLEFAVADIANFIPWAAVDAG